MRGAELWFLHHEFDVAMCGQRATDSFSLVTDDDRDGCWGEPAGRGEHMLDHGPARHFVQHLGARGLHPRALAGGKDDNVNVRHDVHDYRLDGL